MHHQPLVFVDIETTGGRSNTSRIIDIGVIRVENGVVVRSLNQLVQPNEPIPTFISNLTGISNEMLWNQPTFDLIAPELEDILDGALFIAHHVLFDYSFIKAEFKRGGITFNSDRACTVKLSRLLHPERYRHGLDYIIERMNLTVEHRHRGYDDAEVLWKFVQSEMKVDSVQLFMKLAQVTTRARKNNKSTQQLKLLQDNYEEDKRSIRSS
jgi:DNA polymerase-3 subunit epsilon